MFLHIVDLGHSFVERMPYQAGSSAQRIRIGLTGLAFAFLIVLFASVDQPLEPRRCRQCGAAGRDQRAERAAGRARRRAGRVRNRPTTAARARNDSRAAARARLAACWQSMPLPRSRCGDAARPQPLPPRPATERPTLLLLTSLPLIFNEDFSLRRRLARADRRCKRAIA